MSDIPLRLRVLRALTDTIKTVTPANGYTHDLSSAVFRGRAVFGETDPVPMVSILEDPQQPPSDNTRGSAVSSEWNLIVQGFAEDDFEHPTDPAHFLMAEVKKALALERNRGDGYNIFALNDRVERMSIGAGVVRPPDEISAKAYFWLTLTVHLVEDLQNPYA